MQTQYYCYGCSINNTDFPVVNVYVTDFPVVNVYVTDFPVVNVYVTDFPVIIFTNIRQLMLKLKTHSGFHELFRF
jgi:hypothetical protein